MVQPHETVGDTLHSNHYMFILLHETHLHILAIDKNTASAIGERLYPIVMYKQIKPVLEIQFFKETENITSRMIIKKGHFEN